MDIRKNIPRENEVYGFINRKSKSRIEKPPWKAIKDDISVTNGSISSKNCEVFLVILTHS